MVILYVLFYITCLIFGYNIRYHSCSLLQTSDKIFALAHTIYLSFLSPCTPLSSNRSCWRGRGKCLILLRNKLNLWDSPFCENPFRYISTSYRVWSKTLRWFYWSFSTLPFIWEIGGLCHSTNGSSDLSGKYCLSI